MAYTVIQPLLWMENRKSAVGISPILKKSCLRKARRPRNFHGEHRVTEPDYLELLKERIRAAAVAIGDIMYGATVYEMVRDLNKERAKLERLFVLVVFGDLLGVPVLPPYYTLRLLPYIMPNITGWRRSMLRERDLTDLCDQEIT
jgi:hypothetical protein